MNRNHYRIVFNPHRGQLMAVAETARGSGKSAAGESADGPVGGGPGLGSGLGSRCSQMMVAMWLAIGALPMAWTQIIADPAAPANQRPTVLSDSAGRPLVNIQTPSAAGLSRNTYKQFDVPAGGVVLNNSANNPWLSNGVLARTILNEVNSSNQSYINGAITVNGAAAQVIVANPNGITVNGGSFVNASRATLATGTAQVADGVLTGLHVRGGGVTIAAGGLNNSATPYTDIMSRSVTVTGQLRAQNLGITAGLQTVAYDTGLISNQDTNTYLPGNTMVIDTAALGGMYAGNISILSTEAGLGVRNQGTWQAGGGQIVVTADGMLQNLGTVSAGVASLATVNGHVENVGAIQGSQAVLLSAGGDVRQFGPGLKQTAGSAVVISARGSVNLYNNPSDGGAAQVSSNAAGGQVSISAGKNINLGPGTTVAAHGDVQLGSDDRIIADRASTITSANGSVTALAAAGMGLVNANVAGQQVHLESGAAFKDTAAAIEVTGGSVRGQTQTTLLATDRIFIASPGRAAVSGGGNVHIQAAKAVDITEGSSIIAGQHMSVMAGTTATLYAASGNTANTGQKAVLNAGGNLLLSGNTVIATGSTVIAGQDLDIEANDGNVYLQALSNAGGTSVDRINLIAGKDLNVSAFKGSLFATGMQASGQNIALVSNGTTSILNATAKNGANSQAVASTLTARDDLVVGSISTTPGFASQVQMAAASLNAVGKVNVFSSGMTLITSATDSVNGVNTLALSNIRAGSVAIQGGSVQTDSADVRTYGDKSTLARSGDIVVSATSGTAVFNGSTEQRSQFNGNGNIALHANGTMTHWTTQANAGGSLSSTSATGQINSNGASLVAKDMVSLASKGAQTHSSSYISGGAASVYNETGHLALNNTRVQAAGTASAGMGSVSGQTSIESGGTLGLDAASSLYASTDLSIIQGQGDITLNPTTASRGTLAWSQIGEGRSLTLATRNGNINFTGSAGNNGQESSSYVSNYVNGDLNLSGNHVNLQGSRLQTGGALNITATAGDVNGTALQANKTEAGYTNTYWDALQLIGGTGVNVRAAGNIALDSVYAQSNGSVNIQAAGNTTLAAKYAHRTVNNQASGGWYQDERYLWRNTIKGNNGVNIGAMGGTLTLSATDLYAGTGKASLQALGDINIEAAQESRLHEASTSGSNSSCMLGVCKTTSWVDYFHNEYLTNKPVTVTALDIEVKAGNNINTYGTRFSAGRNLTLASGDFTWYHAVYDQKIETARRDSRTGWGIGNLFSIRSGGNSSTNSTFKLAGQPVVLQSQGDILSNSGADQLLQGTKVSYGGAGKFNAGVGETARSDARIILEGIKDTTTQTRTSQANYVVWQSVVNSGSKNETLVLPSFTGPAKPAFSAPGGLLVQIPEGDFKSQIATLSAQPGMGYLNDLTARKDVNWQPVKLAHEQWSYQQSGLTKAGAALVAVAVAWASGGTGAGLVGAANGSMTAAMANAAFTSLAAQASISLINNKGDIGQTLKELGNSQTVKATLAAILTAGVLDKLGTTATMKTLAGQTGFSEKLTYNLINATGRALTNTAINGGNLEDALKAALAGGLVDTLHGQAASQIKGLEADYLAHKLAHALVGCVAGAATGGACRDGAIGGAVGEIVAQLLPPQNGIAYSESEKNNVLALSKLVAGAASAYAGGDAQTAITTAEVAVRNNALVPVLIGVAWLADKAWTAYEVSQDVAAIRDGTKTVEQVALERGEDYVTGMIVGNVGRYGVKAVKAGGKWVQSKDPLSSVMESRGTSNLPSTSLRLTEKNAAFESTLHKLTSGERVALIRQAADEAARIHGFTKDNALSKLNNRTVYRGMDGRIYSSDTQHGEFELINPRTGSHEGALGLFNLQIKPNSLDRSGAHDLKVK